MPTYDYECKACGHRFDEFQNMSDPALTTCPSCNEDTLQRLIGGGIGVIFKGSGFYVTDSKNGSSKSSGGSSDKSESSTSASKGGDAPKSESGSETKKSEPKSSDAKSAAAK